jgi:hypothetical protein
MVQTERLVNGHRLRHQWEFVDKSEREALAIQIILQLQRPLGGGASGLMPGLRTPARSLGVWREPNADVQRRGVGVEV